VANETSKLYTAKLTRGSLWLLEWKIDGVLHEIEFHHNVRVVIDDELYDHLYAYAVDYVNVEGSRQPEERSKFEFVDYKGEAKVGTWLEQPKRDATETERPPRVRSRGEGDEQRVVEQQQVSHAPRCGRPVWALLH
jgi:hypothetical protein